MIARLMVLLMIAPLLGGCLKSLGGTLAGGECKIFERPPYEVRGARPYDQNWIDSQIEGGVGGCGWSRPASRPAQLEAGAVIRAPARPSLAQRIRARLHAAAKVAPQPAPIAAAPAPADPPKPRSALDELLHPSK
jgi:hypothetical protein